MEGSGFMQAATSLTTPSSTLVIKVVSDACAGERITPSSASTLISSKLDAIDDIISSCHAVLKPPPTLDADDMALLERLIASARLSQSQRTEVMRGLLSFKMRGGLISQLVAPHLERDGSSKQARRKLFEELMASAHGVDFS
jgi:hypothetical protein